MIDKVVINRNDDETQKPISAEDFQIQIQKLNSLAHDL